MSTPKPGPLPPLQAVGYKATSSIPQYTAIIACIFVGASIMLRMFGLVLPLSVPTSSMSPAILPGDHLLMEGITFMARSPRKGDVVVFKSDGIESLMPGATYVNRIAGQPGDRLRIEDGRLYVNGAHLPLKNSSGEIRYVFMRESRYLTANGDTVTLPAGQYFVLGDNSTNSFDGRFWGFLPAKIIKGRIAFCYWPPRDAGAVR